MDADNRKPQFDDFDHWLSVALHERASGEPRNGLEERVLARLATKPMKQQFAWWQFWAAAAAMFVIALTLVLIYPQHQDQLATKKPTLAPERKGAPDELTPGQRQPTTKPRATGGRNAACCLSTRMVAKNGPAVARNQPEPLPKLTKFPTPRPETPQEHLLVQLATQPQGIEVASISNDGMPLKELSIPELKTEPMEGTPPDAVRRDEFGRKDASQEHR